MGGRLNVGAGVRYAPRRAARELRQRGVTDRGGWEFESDSLQWEPSCMSKARMRLDDGRVAGLRRFRELPAVLAW